jgi:hypothetical protein
MTVIKGLGTAILSFLLFISLTVFGISFTLQSTLLNPDFVAEQVDKLEITDLVREFADEEIVENLPEEIDFLADIVYDVLEEYEPWLKEQINNAVYAAYDFMQGETDTLYISIPLDEIREDLRESLWTAFTERLPEWLPDLVAMELDTYLGKYIDQLAESIPDEYLPPELVGVPENLLGDYLSDYLHDVSEQVIQDYIPQVSGLLEYTIKPYFDEYYDDFVSEIPEEFAVDEDSVDADTWDILLQVRNYIDIFNKVYYGLIAFMVLLVAGIVLIHRNVRDSTRSLGIGLLTYGVLEFAGVYLARHFLPTDLSCISTDSFNLPDSFQTWLTGFYSDLLGPLQMFSIIILVIGAVLLTVSFVYRRKAAEDYD